MHRLPHRLLSLIFHLTKVYNSRAFYELAKQELNRSRRYRHPLTLAYFDLDNFKTVNDSFGHQIGDQLLAAVGEVIRQSIRASDIAARMGGDEFVLLLVESNSEAARQLIARIQTNLLATMRENGWPVTFSIGMVCWHRPLKQLEELIKAADHLMYEVKNAGKNEVRYQVFEN
jgi:diguanylate cyclase (GGDEF)-like protein